MTDVFGQSVVGTWAVITDLLGVTNYLVHTSIKKNLVSQQNISRSSTLIIAHGRSGLSVMRDFYEPVVLGSVLQGQSILVIGSIFSFWRNHVVGQFL